MIRFPNPGSTLTNFVQVYTSAFEKLNGQVFGLDSLVGVTVADNLATSSGYMGAEAIRRSTRKDRTRDPLYNQLKMYSELFRTLGWIHPTEQRSLSFCFTLLGRQVIEAKQHYQPLFGEALLGICYPTHVLKAKGNHALRPFALLLKTMLASDNALSRDEMIIGPLSAESDHSEDALHHVVELIQSLRTSSHKTEAALTRVASDQRVQANTLRNYTRWPIAAMRDLGWTEKARRLIYSRGSSIEVHQLTDLGRKLARQVADSTDLRLREIDHLPWEEKVAVSVHTHYQMLERGGFDLTPVRAKLKNHDSSLLRALERLRVSPGRSLLFSPFQSLAISDIQRIFPTSSPSPQTPGGKLTAIGPVVGRDPRDHLFVKPNVVRRSQGSLRDTRVLEEELRMMRRSHQSIGGAAAAFVRSRAADSQNRFYPLISGMFRLLGFQSENTPPGSNYQRWDAWVNLDETVAPIEIKSPTEEAFLSTKAIRQALENKVVLLSRRGLNTTADTTTLIVGYQIPNERAELAALIDDIYATYQIRIGVIDLTTLAVLALLAISANQTVQTEQLRTLRGFLNV